MTPLAWALLFTALGVAWIAHLSRREHAARRARHAAIFGPVVDLFESPQITFEESGLPRIEGRYQGQNLRLDLIPDTMTIRRLPQLWLAITSLDALPIAKAGLAVLVRPSGADYYSLTERMSEHFAVPPQFPHECWVRGETPASAATLAKLTDPAAHILTEPKVKEIAATSRGVRLVYQIAEGKRGDYLLLRQCDFAGAQVQPDVLDQLVDGLAALRQSLAAQRVEP